MKTSLRVYTRVKRTRKLRIKAHAKVARKMYAHAYNFMQTKMADFSAAKSALFATEQF